jgi:hypothetical protein
MMQMNDRNVSVPLDADSSHSISACSNYGDSTPPLDDGERLLLQELEEEGSDESTAEIQTRFSNAMKRTLSGEMNYGNPLPLNVAEEKIPLGDTGLIWYATVVPDHFLLDGKLHSGLNPKDFDLQRHTIKSRRPSLPLTMTDLFTSFTKVHGPRWIFHGVLNGWPGLTTLELISLQQKRAVGTMASPKAVLTGQWTWIHHWSLEKEGKDGVAPNVDGTCVYRAIFRGAPWSAIGWSPESPGFAFWFEPQHGHRLTYGTKLKQVLSHDDQCTMVHMISHRYAIERESPRDKLTYHSIVLLEWDHGQYCTVVEGAYLNGIGGYRGRSNWYHDRDEPISSLYQAFPSEMIGPWSKTSAEIRCFDVEAKNFEDFKAFVYQYEGAKKRFIDPHFHFSHKVRLTFRSKCNIASYLLNYIGRDCGYSDMSKNCQTFAADFCGMLAGKKGVLPFHPVSRIQYRDRKHLFLYDSTMYEQKPKGKNKK